MKVDCDRDALTIVVEQRGVGFCHLDTATCWGEQFGLPELVETIARRQRHAPSGSYTRRLLEDPGLLSAKLIEEVGELLEAQNDEDVTWEVADVIYFTLVTMVAKGGRFEDVLAELARRSKTVTRRGGERKFETLEARV
jgi:phosphoribosyl-ATP pyrophosphohydrolase